jgi:hypothetical protein
MAAANGAKGGKTKHRIVPNIATTPNTKTCLCFDFLLFVLISSFALLTNFYSNSIYSLFAKIIKSILFKMLFDNAIMNFRD